MKEQPNLDKMIDEIQKMIDENQRSLVRFIHVGTLMDILYLLKEQEAVEPVVDVDTWACGNCSYPVERDRLIGPNAWLNEQYNYCPNCGKKVKWDG